MSIFDDRVGLQPVSVLFLWAIFLDMIQGASNILSIRWAFLGEVVEDEYCTAQAVMKQIGNDGVGMHSIHLISSRRYRDLSKDVLVLQPGSPSRLHC
ncbi:uncharacterized protein EI90DRAFT_3046611 [Cantharellus anzutake]|uniref:uncharacterized protein n=1 Tax=Cantharellus anzutake TaxID=1750568 RepID=UPI0019037080|nr:uncharacterized protein EI90DRAFT_3046611 [Cantharellus anzutake]KAF8336641.1 hypothetical protein EI90DRAFT_3046611 [Cantharellus anzutake]